MSRGLKSPTDADLDEAFLIPVMFLELALDTDPLYVHTDIGTIPILGRNWLGVGDMGEIGPIEEGLEISPYAFSARLSVVNEGAGTLLEEANNQDFFERECFVYFATRDSVTGAMRNTPDEIFSGRIDQLNITHGFNSAYIDLLAESEMRDFDQATLEYYSDTTQQRDQDGDRFFQWLSAMVNRQIVWGAKDTVQLGSSPTRSSIPSNVSSSFR